MNERRFKEPLDRIIMTGQFAQDSNRAENTLSFFIIFARLYKLLFVLDVGHVIIISFCKAKEKKNRKQNKLFAFQWSGRRYFLVFTCYFCAIYFFFSIQDWIDSKMSSLMPMMNKMQMFIAHNCGTLFYEAFPFFCVCAWKCSHSFSQGKFNWIAFCISQNVSIFGNDAIRNKMILSVNFKFIPNVVRCMFWRLSFAHFVRLLACAYFPAM